MEVRTPWPLGCWCYGSLLKSFGEQESIMDKNLTTTLESFRNAHNLDGLEAVLTFTGRRVTAPGASAPTTPL